jgi:hypothetical protein
MRKAAREQLLLHIHGLLATGDRLESHTSIEHVLRQAEESYQQLLQTEHTTVAPTTLAEEEGSNADCRDSAAADVSPDLKARIFHSGVEAQLATVADIPPLQCTTDTPDALGDDLGSLSATQNMKRTAAKHRRRGAKLAEHVDPADAPSTSSRADGTSALYVLPRSAAAESLLAKSAARQAAGRAAMLSALESLQLALQLSSHDSPTEQVAQRNVTPAWLRVESGEEARDREESDATHDALLTQPCGHSSASTPRSCPSSGTAADTVEYSDDFESRSEQSEVADAHEESEEDDEGKE